MNSSIKNIHKGLFFLSLFALIPLWNIPHTIAGRYICEGILLLTTIFYKPNWKLFFQNVKILLVFFIYLLIHLIFFSKNFNTAFSNFRGEWMHFILFSIIGAGVGLTLGKKICYRLNWIDLIWISLVIIKVWIQSFVWFTIMLYVIKLAIIGYF